MTDLVLDGCSSSPLGGYLSSLGLLRATTRLLDNQALGYWRRQRFVLRSRFPDVNSLVDELHERFVPEGIVSPWNNGSGFAVNNANRAAAESLAWVREASDSRLSVLRSAVQAGDRVVAEGTRRGWGGTGGALWDDKRKRDVLSLCRTEFPDSALPWLDSVVALGQDADPTFSRLLGTGGNFGRQDLSNTYRARVRAVLTDKHGRDWLKSALSGAESVPYLRDAVGQFDPGRAGGIQSSPWEKADDKGFVNPWRFLLTVEGALLFATAVVRRHGAEHADAALPFQVRGSTSGHDTAAADEPILAELWAPEWSTPTRLPEIAHLLAEGRAQWRARPARSGLDFARAVANLGVDRGIDGFQRTVFVDRHGQSPLAVPAGRIAVAERAGVALLGALDPWLERLRRIRLPASVATQLRGLDQALFMHARSGAAADLVTVFAALGRCHGAVARSSATREGVHPLVLPAGRELLAHLRPAAAGDHAVRIALALATGRDTTTASGSPHAPTLRGLRPLLTPVREDARSMPQWSEAPAPTSLASGLAAALAEAARRRCFTDAATEVAVGKPDQEVVAAVVGARIAFSRGVVVRPPDIGHFVEGHADDTRIAEVLAGLLTVDWSNCEDRCLGDTAKAIDPALDLILSFAADDVIILPTDDGGTRRIVLRPGTGWPALLAAGRVAEVLTDAARRLRISGLKHVVEPRTAAPDGRRLASALLLRVGSADTLAALDRISVLPDKQRFADKETPYDQQAYLRCRTHAAAR